MQLLEELGRGNYGTVKKVLHKPTNVLMAMKVQVFSFCRFRMLLSVPFTFLDPFSCFILPPLFCYYLRFSYFPGDHTVGMNHNPASGKYANNIYRKFASSLMMLSYQRFSWSLIFYTVRWLGKSSNFTALSSSNPVSITAWNLWTRAHSIAFKELVCLNLF